MELFAESGVCEAATAKGDGGKTMTKVKALLASSNNRNYIQRERLLKMKAKVIGLPIMGALKWMLIDSVCRLLVPDTAESLTPETCSWCPSTTTNKQPPRQPQ